MSTARRGRRGLRLGARVRSQLGAAATRIRIGLLLLIALCQLLVLRCLDLIGPPPRVRFDALWVRQHRYLVEVGIAAVLVAAAASILLILSRRGGAAMLGLWALFIAAVIILFYDRVGVLVKVIVRYAW